MEEFLQDHAYTSGAGEEDQKVVGVVTDGIDDRLTRLEQYLLRHSNEGLTMMQHDFRKVDVGLEETQQEL